MSMNTDLKEIWELIFKNQSLATANQKLQMIKAEDEYLKNITQIIQAEIELRQGKYGNCINILNEIRVYFIKLDCDRSLQDLQHDASGLELNFLENCYINWIYARALTGLERLKEALEFAEKAMQQWDFYRLARLPFLPTQRAQWQYLPAKFKEYILILRNLLVYPLSKEEWLDLLVPEDFHPKKYVMKSNELPSNPLVSVCIVSYRERIWLQTSIDAIIANAGYENYEIILILQKDAPEDSTGDFLEHEPYVSNPKIKVKKFDEPLGADRAKEYAYKYTSGQLLINLDSHVIPNKQFMQKTVQIFLENPEVNILTYGVVDVTEQEGLQDYFFNEVPYLLNGIAGIKVIREKPELMIPYRNGLYFRQTIMGATFAITRKCYEEIGGYLLKDRSWGDKALAMSAYLYGYKSFISQEIMCIHRWHSKELFHPNTWTEDFKINAQGYALEEIPFSTLILGYFYFSQKYFEEHLVPWIKSVSKDTFPRHWSRFQNELPELTKRKKAFWEKATCSVKDYWLEYGDYIWSKLNETERNWLFPK